MYMVTYGYCRISTPYQNLERQARNIKERFPDAVIVQEVYTGTNYQNRDKLKRIVSKVKAGDRIVFDEVSRMSRNAAEGVQLYEELYNRDVELVFLKEPYVDTKVYRDKVNDLIKPTGDKVDVILEAINAYLIALAKEQVRMAFEQSEKEVMDLRQRTKEGIETARLNGKQIGHKVGTKLHVKKEAGAKEVIKKHNKDFGGSLSNEETWKLAGISKMTFYKYKKQLEESEAK